MGRRTTIAQIVYLIVSTVQHIIERFIHQNRVKDKSRSAPNKIFNTSDERYIVPKIKANPKLSAPKLAAKVQYELAKSCNAETVRRVLRAHNFNGRVARKKPFLNKRHQQSRLAFAKEHVCKKSDFWNFSPTRKLSEFHHGVSGEVYAVDARTLHLKDFTYDGQGPAAYFTAGNSRTPGVGGFRLRDENGSPEVIRRYRREGVTLTLPEGKTLNNIKWFSVWCEEFSNLKESRGISAAWNCGGGDSTES
ncbi:hypothetical protein ILUMI_24415 [Ignelater luminosus]|uniref:DM13 domain-containing protein n=1 Tax=Ignelater luminosus TaxID=2038154 RepID=A0A8K0G0X9_IGNLU|nr:hypothetical protein ILUMI_24415 [Ignelater luminosus]